MSLLGRLGVVDAGEDEIAGVLRGLRALLTARKGYASALPDYGLGDWDVEAGAEALVRGLAQEIEEAVRRYEPRIERPRVTAARPDGGLWVALELTGRIGGVERAARVRVHAATREVEVLDATRGGAGRGSGEKVS